MEFIGTDNFDIGKIAIAHDKLNKFYLYTPPMFCRFGYTFKVGRASTLILDVTDQKFLNNLLSLDNLIRENTDNYVPIVRYTQYSRKPFIVLTIAGYFEFFNDHNELGY